MFFQAHYYHNHNYNKIVKSDWLSTALISSLIGQFNSGAPARAKRAWDRAPYSWNMVNLFSFGCHVIDRAYVRTYVRTYASTDCTGGVGETIKRKGGVSQACLGKSTSLI